MAAPSVVDTVVSLCKRRGFVFPCGEIYGGTRSAWDYGPLGVELKENIKRQWWKAMVQQREDVVGLDSSIILPLQTWVASGHVGRLLGPAHRVPQLPQAPPDGPPAGGRRGEGGQEGPRAQPGRRPDERPRLPGLWHQGPVDRAALLQHDAQDLPRRRRRRVGPALPAPGDRAGHLHQLPQRHAGLAQEAAVRHRPDRQELPQRDHAGQLHLPHPRVRADGDGVLRQARRRRALAPVLDRRAHPVVRRPRHRPRQPAPLRAPQGEALALLQGHDRHRVPLQLRRQRVGRARGHRQPHRLRPRRTPSTRAPTWSSSTRRPTASTRPMSSSRRPVSRAA
jgi:hypothetical protein